MITWFAIDEERRILAEHYGYYSDAEAHFKRVLGDKSYRVISMSGYFFF